MDNRVEIVLAAKDITGKAFAKVQGRLKSLSKAVFSFNGALVGVAGAAGIGYFVKKNLEAADSIAKIADSVGVSTKSLQEYRFVAERSGVATAQLDQGLGAFSKRLGELKVGTGALNTMLNKNNKALKEQLIAAGSTDEALDIFLSTLAKIENQSEKTALSAAAFSRTAGIKMTNLVKGGTKGLEGMRKEFVDLGLVIDEKFLRQAEKAVDQFTNLEYVIKTRLMGAVVSVAPQITGIVGEMTDWVVQNDELIKQKLPVYVDAMATSFKVLLTVAGATNEAFGMLNLNIEKMTRFAENNKKLIQMLLHPYDSIFGGEKSLMGEFHKKKSANEAFNQGDPIAGFEAGILEYRKNKAKKGGAGGSGSGGGGSAGVSEVVWSADYATGENQYDVDYGANKVQAAIDKMLIARNNEAVALRTNIDLQNRMAQAMDDTYDMDYGGITDGMDDIKKAGEETADAWTNAFDGWASGFSATLTDMVWDAEFSFNQILESFGKMITQTMIQQSIVSPMVTGISGLFNPSAKGNAFGSVGIHAYAQGGAFTNKIIDKPTMFAYGGGFGIMGEKGDEAILPLTRTRSGDLGVKTDGGGGGNVEIHFHNAPPVKEQKRSRGRNGGERIDIIFEPIMTGIAAGQNSFTNTLETKYGLSPVLAGR